MGYRPAAMEGCCWWTCSARLWCSGPAHGGSWAGLVGQASWGSWSRGRSWSLAERERRATPLTYRRRIVTRAAGGAAAHLRSGRGLESDRAWRVRVKGSGWGSLRGCRSMTGGTLRRSCGCSAWAEEAFAWTASSRCSAGGCRGGEKGREASGDGF